MMDRMQGNRDFRFQSVRFPRFRCYFARAFRAMELCFSLLRAPTLHILNSEKWVPVVDIRPEVISHYFQIMSTFSV